MNIFFCNVDSLRQAVTICLCMGAVVLNSDACFLVACIRCSVLGSGSDAVSWQKSQGELDGKCYFHVANFIDAVGYGGFEGKAKPATSIHEYQVRKSIYYFDEVLHHMR